MVLLEGGEWYSRAEMEVAFDVARMKLKGGSGTREGREKMSGRRTSERRMKSLGRTGFECPSS